MRNHLVKGKMKVALDTLGCKLNQSETESLTRQLLEAGHHLVSSAAGADVYILNTCTITHTADAKSRHMLRQAKRLNSKTIVVAAGCYAERSPEELAGLKEISLVTGNSGKSNILDMLNALCPPELFENDSVVDGLSVVSRTRSFIKIQDGCTKYCTYCIVPMVRGRETSRPPEQILDEVNSRANDGIQEIILTGTEVGAYNYHETSLKQILELILAETQVPRIRLSSLQPQEITPELLSIWKDSRMCRHFHISLQSGCAATLVQMRRGYTPEEYRTAISLIREQIPDVAITTDMIAGFPGETEDEFEESLIFCKSIGFARIHIFPFSKREGTKAAIAQEQVSESVKKERVRRLIELSDECAAALLQGYIGRKMPVLWEHLADGKWSGYTDNYIRVYTRNTAELHNSITSVNLTGLAGDGVWGETEIGYN